MFIWSLLSYKHVLYVCVSCKKAAYTGFVIPSRYYTSLLFGLMVKFGPSVFYLFGPSIINLVLQFYIYSVLRIWSTSTSLVFSPNLATNFPKIEFFQIWHKLLFFFKVRCSEMCQTNDEIFRQCGKTIKNVKSP